MKLTDGLFQAKKRYVGVWLKDFKIYIKRIIFTLKHGYYPMAQWETFTWFIHSMREILTFYQNERTGTAWIIDGPPEQWEKYIDENVAAYDDKIKTMLEKLDEMDENNPIYINDKNKNERMEKAKNDFFELFSKYFYTFWD